MQYVCGQMSRAAQKRNPGRGSQRLHRALGGTRILLAAAPTQKLQYPVRILESLVGACGLREPRC